MKRVQWTGLTVLVGACLMGLAAPAYGAEIVVPALKFSAQGGGEVKKAEGTAAKADAQYVHFWFSPGHWLEWTVEAPAAGDYELTVRYAGKYDVKRAIQVNGRAVKGIEAITLPRTGRWNDWKEHKAAAPLALQAGRNVIRLTCLDEASARLGELRLDAAGREPIRLPATAFSAEGSGRAQVVLPPTRGTVTGWKSAGHFLEWSVEAPAAGRYAVELHYMSDGYNQLELQVNGEKAKGLEAFILPYTGDEPIWSAGLLPVAVTLQEGKNTLRLTTLGGDDRNVPTIGGPLGLSAIRLVELAKDAAPHGNVLRLLTAAELKRPKTAAKPANPAPLGPPLAAVAGAVALKEGQVFQADGRKVTVGKVDVIPYVENKFSKRYDFENFDNAAVAKFREKYKLDAVVAPGRSEFEKQLLLMKWVWDQWDFGHAQERYNLQDPAEILDQAKREHKFQCMHSAAVLMTAANSMGWVCRQMAIPQHTFCEMWSNEHRKWVLMDATSNYFPEKNGQPLNTYEMRQALLKEGGGVLRGWMSDTGLQHKPQSDSYGQRLLFIGYLANTDSLVRGPQYGNDKFFITKDALTGDKKWHTRDNPENPAVDPYFPVNQAALALVPAKEGKEGELKVTLGTLTPNFKEFQASLDGGPWKATEPTFAWKLHAGENRLQVRSVNKFGVAGAVSTVNLRAE